MTTDQLRQTAAAMIAFADGKRVQCRYTNGGDWIETKGPTWNLEHYFYRTFPEPVSRPWSKPEDVPGPVCWLRKSTGWPCMVVEVDNSFLSIGGGGITGCQVTWAEVQHCEYSTDRLNWKPCVVTEEPK